MCYLDFIKQHNIENLPEVIMNDNWCEGSDPKYTIKSCDYDIFEMPKTYDKFIKRAKQLFKGKKILFCRVGNYLRGEETNIMIGVLPV